MKHINRRAGLSSILLLTLAAAAFAQQTIKVKGDANLPAPIEARLTSKLMARDLPYRVIVPDGYSRSGIGRFPVIYLLHGLTGHFNNWTDRTELITAARKYKAIIVTPEGGNGWYTDSAATPNDKYESYIVKELIPEIDRKYRTMADRKHRVIAGLSMGGYGSLKFGVKYPELFSLVGSFSGALGAAALSEKTSGPIGKTIDAIYGPLDSETRKANDIFRIIKEMPPEQIRSLPFLYLDCGTEDFLIQNNRDFAQLLTEKKVPHEYRQLPGGHTWPYWNSQVQEFLRVADRAFTKK